MFYLNLLKNYFQTDKNYDLNLNDLDIDGLVGSAHKFHGPKGIGFLYLNNKHKIAPYIHGGSQERNMRGGTENIYGIAALAKAMEMAYKNLDEEVKYIKGLKLYMIEKFFCSIKT